MQSKYKRSGWFKESHRHSLARQGIKTGRKDKHIDYFGIESYKGRGVFDPFYDNQYDGDGDGIPDIYDLHPTNPEKGVEWAKPEIKGQQLRIRAESPSKFKEFRTQDVGKRGHLQRLAGKDSSGWKTQSWRLSLKDYKSFAEAKKDIEGIKGISAERKKYAVNLAKKYFKNKADYAVYIPEQQPIQPVDWAQDQMQKNMNAVFSSSSYAYDEFKKGKSGKEIKKDIMDKYGCDEETARFIVDSGNPKIDVDKLYNKYETIDGISGRLKKDEARQTVRKLHGIDYADSEDDEITDEVTGAIGGGIVGSVFGAGGAMIGSVLGYKYGKKKRMRMQLNKLREEIRQDELKKEIIKDNKKEWQEYKQKLRDYKKKKKAYDDYTTKTKQQ